MTEEQEDNQAVREQDQEEAVSARNAGIQSVTQQEVLVIRGSVLNVELL